MSGTTWRMGLKVCTAWTVWLGAALIGVLVVFSVLPGRAADQAGPTAVCAVACEVHGPALRVATAGELYCDTTGSCKTSRLCHSGDCLVSPFGAGECFRLQRFEPGVRVRFEWTRLVASSRALTFDPPPPRSFA